MIIPSRNQQQPHRALPSLKELWEKVVSAMPLRITLTPPTEDVRKLKRATIKPDSEALRIAELVGEQDAGHSIGWHPERREPVEGVRCAQSGLTGLGHRLLGPTR